MEIDDQVDLIEDTIRRHGELLNVLLLDRSLTSKNKNHNIIWATDSYPNHKSKEEIKDNDITGVNRFLIQPRIAKTKEEQIARTKDKAEVFTPKKIVDQMNKQIDFNSPNWPATNINWKDYVNENRLEITCGEAPFIVGRYNVASGVKVLNLSDRVGFLDRKMRVVSEFCNDKCSWLEWAKNAYKASYGYEWQGDNLLLARENLLYTFIDYWNDKFPTDKINLERKVSEEKIGTLMEIAYIISWNIFQMDGIKYVIPMSCKSEIKVEEAPPLLKQMYDEKDKVSKSICPGCASGDAFRHNGKYVKIMDWQKNKVVKFVDIIKDCHKKGGE